MPKLLHLKEKQNDDDFRVDTARRLLLQADRQLTLTPRVFDALVYLVRHQGRVVPKEELMEAIWPNAFVEENNLPQRVHALLVNWSTYG